MAILCGAFLSGGSLSHAILPPDAEWGQDVVEKHRARQKAYFAQKGEERKRALVRGKRTVDNLKSIPPWERSPQNTRQATAGGSEGLSGETRRGFEDEVESSGHSPFWPILSLLAMGAIIVGVRYWTSEQIA